MPAPAASSRYAPLVSPAAEEEEGECDQYAARARYYAPLRRDRGEYAARRALFLQSYRFTTAASPAATVSRDDGGLRGRVARRVRDAVARAWRVGVGWWWPRARLGCFGGHGHGRKLHYLHGFA
uniref:Uncharacterized protein n=1 Tax=Leersia perrieri TaxID=77586 RepID=A0A0D9XFN2_9ORYZ